MRSKFIKKALALGISVLILTSTFSGFVTKEKYICEGTENVQVEENTLSNLTLSLPTSYDSRDKGYVTDVRDQGKWNTGWAFATVAAIESYVLSHGMAKYPDKLDLSEYNLAFMAYNDSLFNDPLGGTDGDYHEESLFTGLQKGGNSSLAFKVLSKWGGITTEILCPYPEYSTSLPGYNHTISNNLYILSGMKYISMEDRQQVKQAIIDNGAVSIEFCDGEYYNGNYYYNYCDTETNNSVAIVGWDDNISKESFTITDSDGVNHTPAGDGGWLVKNSHGTDVFDKGYMWISYYDLASSGENAVVYEMSKPGIYDNIYQYDGNTFFKDVFKTDYDVIPHIYSNKYANVFKVPEGKRKQKISAVSFGILDETANYSIQIYKNPMLNEEVKEGYFTTGDDPERGTPMLSKPITGSISNMGYYTIPVQEEIVVEENDTFAIVITFDRRVEIPYTYCASNRPLDKSVSLNNQSYYLYHGETLGDLYEDVHKKNKKVNLCIKAFTTSFLKTPYIIHIIRKTEGGVWVHMSPSSEYEVFEVYRSSSKDGPFEFLGTSISDEYIDYTAEKGILYYYKIRAYNQKDGVYRYSDMSMAKGIIATSLEINGLVDDVTVNVGENISLTASAKGGYEKYKYKFVLINPSTGEEIVLKNFGEENSFTAPITNAGEKFFYVVAKDSRGLFSKSNEVHIYAIGKLSAALKANGSSSANAEIGDKVTLSVLVNGGLPGYTYQYYMKNAETGKDIVLKKYSSDASYIANMVSKGTKEFFVSVKDSKGTVVTTNSVKVVVREPLGGNVKVNGGTGTLKLNTGTNITIKPVAVGGDGTYTYRYMMRNGTNGKTGTMALTQGTTVKLTAGVSGGFPGYKYQFAMKNVSTGQSVVLKDYTSSSTFSAPFTSAGTKLFFVKIKDSSGIVVESNVVTVEAK